MIKVLQIYENELLQLDSDCLAIASEMKSKNKDLPYEILEGRIAFSAYTVGTIKIKDLVINILPRNEAFSLETIFDMILFNKGILSSTINSVGYDSVYKSGGYIIPEYFYSLCKKLVNFGLTGDYVAAHEYSKILKGTITPEKFHQQIITTNGIHCNFYNYLLDVPANQIIKTALIKIEKIFHHKEYNLLLKEFDTISAFYGRIEDYEYLYSKFYSSNPFYPEVIRIALTILKDIKLSFVNGNLEWYSFLQNSNNLFEEYARKLISKTLNLPVLKWEIPHKYASLSYNNNISYKSFSPDILVGYNPIQESAKIVLDVKNKSFDPEKKCIADLVDPSDLYQILFYCRKLKTKLGGLIYPANKDFKPISIIINDDSEFRIILFTINMKSCYNKRYNKIKNDITEYLLNYI